MWPRCPAGDPVTHDAASGRTSPVASPTPAGGAVGDTIVAGVSSSLKIRSDEAIAAWRRLNFSEMSLIGRKKRCEYWMKATSDPSVSAPASTLAPPYQMINAVASALVT